MREKINEFCDDNNHFPRLPKLLQEFLQQNKTSGSQQTVYSLDILKSTLDACNNVNLVATFQTMIMAWRNGASFGLTPFKAEFFDYMECDIPVKDVTKVKKVIGIGTTIHKFKNSKGDGVCILCVS